jgi:hypothetical protein
MPLNSRRGRPSFVTIENAAWREKFERRRRGMTKRQRVQESGRVYEGLRFRNPLSRWCGGASGLDEPGPWHPDAKTATRVTRRGRAGRTSRVYANAEGLRGLDTGNTVEYQL